LGITFGTDGWRDIMDQGFNIESVRECAQGLSNYLIHSNQNNKPIVVGYDTRKNSKLYAKEIASVLTSNSISCLLSTKFSPTPAISFSVIDNNAAGALIVTSSHNPYQWNGIKYKSEYGGSAFIEVIENVESEIRDVQNNINHIINKDLLFSFDPKPNYQSSLKKFVDLNTINESKLNILVDYMYGAGIGFFDDLLDPTKIHIKELHSEPNFLFPGMDQPEPIPKNLTIMALELQKGEYDVGIAFDGDADRLGLFDGDGNYVNTIDAFALIILHLFENKQLKGGIATSLTMGRIFTNIANDYKVPIIETAVGFPHLCRAMLFEEVLIAGEESGGYAYKFHIPERDGILSALLILELLAITGKSLIELKNEMYAKYGRTYYNRLDLKYMPHQNSLIVNKLKNISIQNIGDKMITLISYIDGVKFYLEDNSWGVIRISGTEPLVRIYAESNTKEEVLNIISELEKYLFS
jgi:phosphomannomutase